MHYEGNIIRPPSEANSIILQVTAGCSYNKCTFCGAYKDKQFKIRLHSLSEDLEFAAQYCRRQTRVFLADGDALILPFTTLVCILQSIRKKLPWIKRISLYANCRSIRSKSPEELLHLKSLGLDRVYLGLESGHDDVLATIKKGETSQSMIRAAAIINDCGLFLSVTILLGIAGYHLSHKHAEATGTTLSLMKPNQIAALTVIPLPGTPLHSQVTNGTFILPDAKTILQELKTVIQFITLDRVQFYANHASNFLPLSGRLQKDKNILIAQINDGINGSVSLKSEALRRL